MNNALLYLGGFVILVLAALFAVPTFVDWNGYRGVFEEQASHVLGRDVRVGGTVNVRLLPAPYVQFEKLRISDAGDTGESLFRAESFKMWLAVPPLLRGVFQANEIELKRPVLRLAVDATGGGNWSTLSFAAGTLPFVPADVALDKVRITDGVLSLNGAQGAELARIDGVQGELTSETLEGPFKFRGKVKWEGAERDVRLSTARSDPNGDIRFKTNVAVAGSQNSYTIDGKVTDLKQRPRIDGELTAKIAIAAPPAADAKDAKGSRAGFDVRGKVTGDATGFKLQDIAISLEQTGPPQIVTGEASMSWADKVRVDAVLGSRWLDLDATAAGGQGARPMEAAGMLFEAFTDLLPAEAETYVSLKLDQINLGAQAVSGVRLQVVRAGGPLELKEFRANVPGGGRLALDGVLSVAQRPAQFEGNLALDAQSAVRFLSWALRDPAVGDGRTDSPFAVSGRLLLGDKLIELKGATAEVGALPVRGDVRLDLGQRRRLALTLEGHKIDVGQLFPGSIGLRALAIFKSDAPAAKAAPDEATPTAPAAARSIFDTATSDMVVRIRAGELVDGDRVLKNVAADIAVDGDRLVTETLRFETDDGLEVDVVGEADAIRQTASGALKGIVAASSPQAVGTLFRLLDLAEGGGSAEARLAELAPFRLAGTVGLGQHGTGAVDIKADGEVQGGRMVSKLRLDAGRDDWHMAPVELALTVEGPRAARTLAGLARGGAPALGDGIEAKSTSRKLIIKAVGVPSKGLQSVVALSGQGMALDYMGLVTIPSEGVATARDGRLRIATEDAREALAIAGLPFGGGIEGLPLEGEATAAFDGKELSLRPRRLTLGGSSISGVVSVIAAEAGKPVELRADLGIDQGSLPRLLAPFLASAPVRPVLEAPAPQPVQLTQQRRQGEPSASEPPPLQDGVLTPGIWPEQTFDLAVLDRVGGEIKATFKSLRLDEGLAVADAGLVARLEPQRLVVESLGGAALGGRLTSRMMFERAAAGVGLTGSLRIAAGGSGEGDGGAKAGAGGQSSLDVEFSGRALSPAALVTDLKGKGKLVLGDVTLSGIGGPAAVSLAAETALQGKGPTSGEPLVQAIRGSLRQGNLPLSGLEIPVVVRDGSMKLDRVTVERDTEGRLTFDTTVEIGSMKFDSEWRIEGRIKSKADESSSATILLPAVPVVYAGKLKDFATIEATIDTAALERELTVRKMERDVDQLERLRKLDQEKAKQEQDRLKALEEEQSRQKAIEEERARSGTGAAPASGGTSTAATEPAVDAATDPDVPADSAGDPVSPDGTAATPAEPSDRTGLGRTRPRSGTSVKKARPQAPASTYKRPAQSWNPFVTP